MHPSYFNQALRGHLGNELRRQVEGTCSGRLGYIVAVVQEEVDASGSHRGRIMEDGQAVFSIKYRAVVYRPFRNEVVDGVVSSVNKVRRPRSSSPGAFGLSPPVAEPAADSRTSARADGHLCRRRTVTVFHLDPCASHTHAFLHAPVTAADPHPVPFALAGLPAHPQLVPPDFSFDPNSNPPCFSSSEDTVSPRACARYRDPSARGVQCSSTDNGQLSFRAPTLQLTIQKGTKIRLKIVGTRIDATEIVSPSRVRVWREPRLTRPRLPLVQFAIGTIKEDYLGPLG